MKASWIFYMILGMGFVFLIYVVTLGQFSWWFTVYYIIIGFLGVMALFYPSIRWWFIIGLIFGTLLLLFLQSKGTLQKGNSFLPF